MFFLNLDGIAFLESLIKLVYTYLVKSAYIAFLLKMANVTLR